jgi:hypothetical protein
VFNWSMMNIHCPFGSVATLFLMNVRKSSDVRVGNKIPLTFPLPISNDAMSVVVPCRIYSCSCFSQWFWIKGLSGSALSIDCMPDFSSTDSKWTPSDFSLMASLYSSQIFFTSTSKVSEFLDLEFNQHFTFPWF